MAEKPKKVVAVLTEDTGHASLELEVLMEVFADFVVQMKE